MSLRYSLAFLSVLAAPAAAQFQSEGYKFLQAVRDAKTNEVVTTLNKPGTTVVNTRDVTSGEAALHITARRGDVAYTTFLLQKGADPNIRDGKGSTPMLTAIDSGHGDMASLLILGRANVNLANSSGETPLIRAVQRRDLALVRVLLAANADPDQRDVIAGLSARDYAARDTRSPAISKVLADAPKATKRAVSGPKL
jgi:ankyrin repeat protein